MFNKIRDTGTYGSLYEPPFTGTVGSLRTASPFKVEPRRGSDPYAPPLEMPTLWVGITTRDFQVFVHDGSPPFETGKAAEGGSSWNVIKEQDILTTFIF